MAHNPEFPDDSSIGRDSAHSVPRAVLQNTQTATEDGGYIDHYSDAEIQLGSSPEDVEICARLENQHVALARATLWLQFLNGDLKGKERTTVERDLAKFTKANGSVSTPGILEYLLPYREHDEEIRRITSNALSRYHGLIQAAVSVHLSGEGVASREFEI